MKVAVISDLHIGDMAKGKDFSPDKTENASVDNYLEEFEAFVKTNNLSANYVVVSGDISNRAKEQEFSLASSLIEKIARALGVPRERILFCPGNHDMDWAAINAQKTISASEDAVIVAKHNNFLKKGLLFSDNLKGAAGEFHEAPYVVSWDFDDLSVYALNSAVYDEPDTAPHRGEIKSSQLEWLDSYLSAQSSDKLKIFILHHHPKQYHDRTFREADTSGMINAQGLLRVLAKHQVDFVVHGHKHIPRFDLELNTLGHPVWILCAGSFSSRLDDRHFGGVGNAFHIVEFHERCKESGWARGLVQSWVHLLGHKWIESGSIDFDSVNQFGAYLPSQSLRETLEKHIQALLVTSDVVRWSDLLAAHSSIQYYPNDLLRKDLDFVSRKMNLLMNFSNGQRLFKSLILIKDTPL